MSKVVRTYSSKRKAECLSSPGDPSSSKRPLATIANSPPRKRSKSESSKPPRTPKRPAQQQKLTQLHFCIEESTLRTCSLCDLSYTKGALEDEALHKSHCARVLRGMEWSREEERERVKAGVEEVESRISLKDGRKGRIICFKACAGGRVGSKMNVLLETINLTLSAPPLTPEILQESKAYLFLVPGVTASREKIVGCVIAQRISSAMAIATPDQCTAACKAADPNTPPSLSPTAKLVAVDTSTGLFCLPKLLPTPLGIPRLFVPSVHRRQGIATHLLSAAARTFVHGCPLDPTKGDIAFTQPTGAGNGVMQKWGQGNVRIYEE